jgi:hypothetical protein
MPLEERRALAEEIYILYNAKLLTQVHLGRKKVTTPFSKILERTAQWFMKAAEDCSAAGAGAKQWVEAQFVRFQLYSRKLNKFILPQPYQLCGEAATMRYTMFNASLRRLPDRRDKALEQHSREERKLKGLVRVCRQPESDVLLARPEEFTPGFLRYKGVWSYVESKYRTRVA